MSKEVTRFIGALVIIGSLVAGVLGHAYFYGQIQKKENRAEIAKQLYRGSSDIPFDTVRTALADVDKAEETMDYFVAFGYPTLLVISIFGLYLLIVAPVRKPAVEAPKSSDNA